MSQANTYETVIFDFHGVLCHDHFYSHPQYRQLQQAYPGVYEFIQTHIFQSDDILNQWMRNHMISSDVNHYIADKVGIEVEILSKILLASVARLVIDQRLGETYAYTCYGDFEGWAKNHLVD